MKHDSTLIPSVVEEMARFDGSVPRSWRLTKSETQIGGVRIPTGHLVFAMLAAANRDERVFENPNEFNPLRDTKKYLAYGKGVHVCLGAPLARIEAHEAISLILEHFYSVEFATDPIILVGGKI